MAFEAPSPQTPPEQSLTIPYKSDSESDLDLDEADEQQRRQTAFALDEHGFILNEEEAKARFEKLDSEENRAKLRKQNERLIKWLHMRDNWELFTTRQAAKLKSRIRKGIPSALRCDIWQRLAGIQAHIQKRPTYFEEHLHEPMTKIKNVIDRDLDRTFPKHDFFHRTNSPGQSALRNVLYALANHDPDVGYCQGMGFLVALFLMFMPEEEAFWMMVRLLDDGEDGYGLRGLYLPGLPKLQLRYFQFSYLLNMFAPRIATRLKSFSSPIVPEFYASKWFITVFCYDYPFECVLRIWDIFLNEKIKFVFRVALSLLMKHEEELLRMDFEDTIKFLQSFPSRVEAESLIAGAFDVKLKHTHLAQAKVAYERSLEQRS